MTDGCDKRSEAADATIKKHVVYSMMSGAIPIPVVDLAAATAVQLDMLKDLAKVYDVPLNARSAKAFVLSITTALAGRALGRFAASAVKIIPGVGWAAGGVAQAGATGASTYAVGTLFKRLFCESRDFEELDVAAVKGEVQSYYEEGKAVAESLKDAVKDRIKGEKD